MFSQIFTVALAIGAILLEDVHQSPLNGVAVSSSRADVQQAPKIYLTVSSLTPNKKDRLLVINWKDIPIPNDGRRRHPTITLYDSSSPLESINITIPTGSHTTTTKYPEMATPTELTSETPSPHCTPFHIELTSSSSLADFSVTSCLALYPTWMGTLASTIGHTPLSHLVIPGTHDAGAYEKYNKGIFNNYVIAQEESIYSQLVHGIRYLDIRIGHYAGTFTVNHDVLPVRELSVILDDINAFTRQFPSEVIIFDIHRTPVGFGNDTVHHSLISYLSSYLNKNAFAPKDIQLTYHNLKKANSSIILTYPHSHIREQYDFLHENVHHAWAETNDVEKLLTYQKESVEKFGCGQKLWSAMMELTPTPNDVILKPFFGLRGFANLVNPKIQKWYTEIEDFRRKSNVVATDFFLGNNLIQLAFAYNKFINGKYCESD